MCHYYSYILENELSFKTYDNFVDLYIFIQLLIYKMFFLDEIFKKIIHKLIS